jgi:hypothetical protein
MNIILRTLLTFLKIFLLLFVVYMAGMQIPEIIYDFGPVTPIEIEDPSELAGDDVSGTIFASIKGTPDFTNAFVYQRYGLDHHYFTVEPYGMKMVVRTYDKITDEWRQINRFVGRLRPFEDQPFSRYVAAIYLERFGAAVPEDAWFLALDDVPKPSGWQIGGLVFSSILWLIMFWLFFLKGHKKFNPWRSSPPL